MLYRAALKRLYRGISAFVFEHIIVIFKEIDGVGARRPFGIKRQIACGHFCTLYILCAVKTFWACVPPRKGICALFESRGVLGLLYGAVGIVNIAVQRAVKLNARLSKIGLAVAVHYKRKCIARVKKSRGEGTPSVGKCTVIYKLVTRRIGFLFKAFKCRLCLTGNTAVRFDNIIVVCGNGVI